MFDEILLAIDLEEAESSQALVAATRKVVSEGTVLHVMAVVPGMGMPLVSGFFPADYEKKTRDAASEKLHAWTKEHFPDVPNIQHIIGQGAVYREILDTVKKLSPDLDLVIMGAHRPDLEDYLMGPNAAKVVRHANLSVLIVRS